MKDELETILVMVDEYLHSNDLHADIKTFSHPDELLRYCKMGNAQLYILDIVMPMMSGVQLAQEIRLLDQEAQIIFATTAPEYALDSFSVNPLNYLIKPIHKDKLFATLTLAMNKIQADEQSLLIKTKNGLHTILVSSVVSCEYVKHSVKYTLTNGELIETTTIKGSFAEYITPLLADPRFIQPHSSFLINMCRVEKLSRDGIRMRGGAFVPVSAKMFSNVKKAYIDYRLKDGTTL